jgi:hypothetical protein
MHINPDTAVVELGDVPLDEIERVLGVIETDFAEKWVFRGSKLMNQSRVLKARTISEFDLLAKEDADALFELLEPMTRPYMGKDDKLVYLDVSSLPNSAASALHVDYLWMQAVARRIRIPIKTNPRALFATVDSKNEVTVHNLKVGKAYSTNNMIPHSAANYGPDRWHVVFDILTNEEYEFLTKTNRITEAVFSPYVNAALNPVLAHRCRTLMAKYPAN